MKRPATLCCSAVPRLRAFERKSSRISGYEKYADERETPSRASSSQLSAQTVGRGHSVQSERISPIGVGANAVTQIHTRQKTPSSFTPRHR